MERMRVWKSRRPGTSRSQTASPATGQRSPEQPGCVEPDFVRRRPGLQMARPTEALRQLAHDLHTYESLEQEWMMEREFESRPVDCVYTPW
jgi:hypothetical protein